MVHYLLTYKIHDEEKEKTKQTTRLIFLKQVTLPQEEPEAGPSEDIPKEGLINTAP